MTGRLGKKWLVVGGIWGVVLAMTVWNIHLINRVQLRRQELQTLQMDLRFLEANLPGIEEVHRQKSRLTHAVKSFGLGFVVVESNLKRLSWDFGLEQMQVEVEKNVQAAPSAPITVLAVGPIPSIVGWIAAVEDAYPYLVIAHMDIVSDNQRRSSRLQAIFNYRFSLSEPERTG
jgi:hypothetical protein